MLRVAGYGPECYRHVRQRARSPLQCYVLERFDTPKSADMYVRRTECKQLVWSTVCEVYASTGEPAGCSAGNESTPDQVSCYEARTGRAQSPLIRQPPLHRILDKGGGAAESLSPSSCMHTPCQ